MFGLDTIKALNKAGDPSQIQPVQIEDISKMSMVTLHHKCQHTWTQACHEDGIPLTQVCVIFSPGNEHAKAYDRYSAEIQRRRGKIKLNNRG